MQATRSTTPLLTICIATYQRPLWLYHNLKNLVAQIETSSLIHQVEILIRNDDPNQAELIEKIVASFRKRYITYSSNSQNLGLAGNLTRQMQSSHGVYTLLLSDDDFLVPDALAEMLPKLKLSNADVFYLNYQPVVANITSSRLITREIDSMFYNKYNINKDLYFKKSHEFLDTFFSLGFFQTRLLLSQQSVCIVKTTHIQKNLALFFNNNSVARGSLPYPHSSYLWFCLPNTFYLFNKPLVLLTTNNHAWNRSAIKANNTVREGFNPILLDILSQYGSRNSKIAPYVVISILYSYLAYFILLIAHRFNSWR